MTCIDNLVARETRANSAVVDRVGVFFDPTKQTCIFDQPSGAAGRRLAANDPGVDDLGSGECSSEILQLQEQMQAQMQAQMQE